MEIDRLSLFRLFAVTSQQVTQIDGKDFLNSTSESCGTIVYKPASLDIAHLAILIVVTSICIGSNSAVLFVIRKTPRLQTPTNAFICNLALSDLLQGVLFLLYDITHMSFFQNNLGTLIDCYSTHIHFLISICLI